MAVSEVSLAHSHTDSFTYCLSSTLCHNKGPVEQLKQRTCDCKYLLSGPLLKQFADPCFKLCPYIPLINERTKYF